MVITRDQLCAKPRPTFEPGAGFHQACFMFARCLLDRVNGVWRGKTINSSVVKRRRHRPSQFSRTASSRSATSDSLASPTHCEWMDCGSPTFSSFPSPTHGENALEIRCCCWYNDAKIADQLVRIYNGDYKRLFLQRCDQVTAPRRKVKTHFSAACTVIVRQTAAGAPPPQTTQTFHIGYLWPCSCNNHTASSCLHPILVSWHSFTSGGCSNLE